MTLLQGFKRGGRGRDTISVALTNEAPSSLLPMVGGNQSGGVGEELDDKEDFQKYLSSQKETAVLEIQRLIQLKGKVSLPSVV
jgi:hypothetical protein